MNMPKNRQSDIITLSHGSGGALTQELIQSVFLSRFGNNILKMQDDAAVLPAVHQRLAMTTDSFVVDPLFFPGGNIGKLAVCGTVNDLASCAAEPRYLSASFILEEGLAFHVLETVADAMALEARAAGVAIVTGDTKVVPKGKADKMFVNTTGIGRIRKLLSHRLIKPSDKILINGPVGEHGLSVLAARENLSVSARLKSDCQALWGVVKLLMEEGVDIHFMRDPTRGGVSAATNEISRSCGFSMLLEESRIPVTASCSSLCEILGLEILDIANEGKMLFFVGEADAARALKILKTLASCRRASVIGEVLPEKKSKVYLTTLSGGRRVLGMPVTEPIPRIC